MSFLQNFIKERTIKKIANCNKMIEYHQQKIIALQKCIEELESCLDVVLQSHPSFMVSYSENYTQPIEKHRETISLSFGEIQYWETLKAELTKQLES